MKKTEKRQVENEGLLEFGYGYNSKGELSNLTYPLVRFCKPCLVSETFAPSKVFEIIAVK